MVVLRSIMIAAVLMALIPVVIGDNNKRLHARHAGGHHGGSDGFFQGSRKPCTDNPERNPFKPPCQTTPAVPVTSTDQVLLGGQIDTEIANSSSGSTALERAHWCRFPNGTYVPLGYTYKRGTCMMCRCLKFHAIRCDLIECLPTYCVHDQSPIRKSDQCCTQCATDVAKRNSCEYNGVSYPHGAVMKKIEDKMTCWCQLGDIECRQWMGSLFQGWNALTDGTMIYLIVMVVLIILFFGFLLCLGCTFFLYSYVQQNQQLIERAYNEYAGIGGWQPITEEESYAADNTVDEKYVVDEKQPFGNPPDDSIPPPYEVYDTSYVQKKP